MVPGDAHLPGHATTLQLGTGLAVATRVAGVLRKLLLLLLLLLAVHGMLLLLVAVVEPHPNLIHTRVMRGCPER
jgi:hypothetical protein